MNASIQDFAGDKKFKKEKIDGQIYFMASPAGEHRDVQENISNIFNDYFKRNKRRCRSRIDHEVYVNEDNYYEPDVKVLCRETRNDDIPVIVIEVLSKSTRARDVGVKMKKYAELGIKEYWLVDWKECTIDIYLPENNKYEHSKTYVHYQSEEEIKKERLDEDEKKELLVNEFSPISFPELIIKLEDVFDIFI